MGFSRQEYWSGLPCPPPGDLPDLGMEPESLTFPALTGGIFTTNATGEAPPPVCLHVVLTSFTQGQISWGTCVLLPRIKE